jgi:TonB family protein
MLARSLIVAATLAFVTAAAAQETPSAAPADSVTRPTWLERPDGDVIWRHYPESAMNQLVVGRVVLDCVVLLDPVPACSVLDETPADWGFADAAVAISRTFRFVPATVNGAPVAGGRVRVPLRFTLEADDVWEERIRAEMPEGLRAHVDAPTFPDAPLWAEAPNYDTVRTATPTAAASIRGRAVLSCRVRDDRRLRCEPISERPEGLGLGDAAMQLAPLFRVAEEDADFIARRRREAFPLAIMFGETPANTPTSVFYNGVGPVEMPGITAPVYAYPPTALAQRVSGDVAVLCTLTETSAANCSVESETPGEWGFGAVTLAAVSAIPMPAEEGLLVGDQVRYHVRFRPP